MRLNLDESEEFLDDVYDIMVLYIVVCTKRKPKCL